MIRRLLALAVVIWALGFAVFTVTLPRPAAPAITDAVVVPTGGPGRIQRGLAVLAGHQARRMLVTGVGPHVSVAALAEKQHVPLAPLRCCVDLGREAIDTRTNADETAAWVAAHRYRSVRLVTSDWHMPRARLEIGRALGPKVMLIADAVADDADLSMLFFEYNKYLLRRIAVLVGL